MEACLDDKRRLSLVSIQKENQEILKKKNKNYYTKNQRRHMQYYWEHYRMNKYNWL